MLAFTSTSAAHAQASKQLDKANIAKGFDRAATRYKAKATIQRDIANRAMSELMKQLSSTIAAREIGGCALDIGCGAATTHHLLSKHFESWVGLDLSHAMLAQARSSDAGDANYLQADAEQLPVANNSIDAVFSSMALQWCACPTQVLSEIHRVLSPKGTAVLAILCGESFSYLNEAWQAQHKSSRLNQFHSASTWCSAANNIAQHCEFTSESFYTYHASSIDMLRSIKQVGADSKWSASSVSAANDDTNDNSSENGTISKAELLALENRLCLRQPSLHQSNSAENDKFVLDYHVLFISMQKS